MFGTSAEVGEVVMCFCCGGPIYFSYTGSLTTLLECICADLCCVALMCIIIPSG